MYMHIFIILYVHTYHHIITVTYTYILNNKIVLYILGQTGQEGTKPDTINFTITDYVTFESTKLGTINFTITDYVTFDFI